MRLFFFVIFTLSIMACEEIDPVCGIDKNVEAGMGIYSRVDSTDLRDTLRSVGVIGIGVSDSLFTDSVFLSELRLPLSPFGDSVSFALSSNLGVDTISFYYKREVIFFSEECGFLTQYELLKVDHTRNFIDSVSIENNRLTTEDEEHCRLYL